ncbi:MAG: hypothetical protein AAGJ35_05875, partial [Myxococcota bacterium]
NNATLDRVVKLETIIEQTAEQMRKQTEHRGMLERREKENEQSRKIERAQFRRLQRQMETLATLCAMGWCVGSALIRRCIGRHAVVLWGKFLQNRAPAFVDSLTQTSLQSTEHFMEWLETASSREQEKQFIDWAFKWDVSQ